MESDAKDAEGDPKPQSSSQGIHPVDLVLMLVAISFAATLVLLDRFAIPAYAKMYEEFASELPWITRAVISHVVPLVVAALAVVVGACGMVARRRASDSLAVILGLAGITIGIGGVVFCFYALYAPMFELAGKIKP